MKDSVFWTYLLLISSFVLISIFFIHKIQVIETYALLSYLALAFMVIGTTVLYFSGKSAVNSENKYAFIHLVIASVFVKIVIAIGIIAVYSKIVQPTNKYFVIPFLGIYLLFSVFETIILYKMALLKQTNI